jgi:peroxiredoxin
MLRLVGTALILGLLVLNWMLPSTSMGRRGSDMEVKDEIPSAKLAVGKPVPDLELRTIDGTSLRLADFRGKRVLLTFERSVDWCPFTKARLVELRDAFSKVDDLVILYVMADNQINAKTLRFIDEGQLRERIYFIADPEGRLIADLGLAKEDPEPREAGVPHPATYLIDRQGQIRLADVRRDYHVWIAPEALASMLAGID